jgi:hypothetical protein
LPTPDGPNSTRGLWLKPDALVSCFTSDPTNQFSGPTIKSGPVDELGAEALRAECCPVSAANEMAKTSCSTTAPSSEKENQAGAKSAREIQCKKTLNSCPKFYQITSSFGTRSPPIFLAQRPSIFRGKNRVFGLSNTAAWGPQIQPRRNRGKWQSTMLVQYARQTS